MIPYEELVAALQAGAGDAASGAAWPAEPPKTLQNAPLTRDPEGTAVDVHSPADRSNEIDLGDVLSDEEV